MVIGTFSLNARIGRIEVRRRGYFFLLPENINWRWKCLKLFNSVIKHLDYAETRAWVYIFLQFAAAGNLCYRNISLKKLQTRIWEKHSRKKGEKTRMCGKKLKRKKKNPKSEQQAWEKHDYTRREGTFIFRRWIETRSLACSSPAQQTISAGTRQEGRASRVGE